MIGFCIETSWRSCSRPNKTAKVSSNFSGSTNSDSNNMNICHIHFQSCDWATQDMSHFHWPATLLQRCIFQRFPSWRAYWKEPTGALDRAIWISQITFRGRGANLKASWKVMPQLWILKECFKSCQFPTWYHWPLLRGHSYFNQKWWHCWCLDRFMEHHRWLQTGSFII